MTNLTGAAEMRVTASTNAAADAREARVHEHDAVGARPDHDVAAGSRDHVEARANVLHSQFGHGLGRFCGLRGAGDLRVPSKGTHSVAQGRQRPDRKT